MGLPQAAHLEMLAVGVCAAARSFTYSFSDCVASICKKKMSFIKVNSTSHFSFNNMPYGIFSTADNVGGLCFFFKFSYIAIGWSERYFRHVRDSEAGPGNIGGIRSLIHSCVLLEELEKITKGTVVWTCWLKFLQLEPLEVEEWQAQFKFKCWF